MALFEPKAKERKLAWGRIVFNDKYHITVESPPYIIIFHRYGAPRGNYGTSWRLFRQEIRRRRLESIYDVYRYAEKYDVTHYVKRVRVAQRSDRSIELGKEREDNEREE